MTSPEAKANGDGEQDFVTIITHGDKEEEKVVLIRVPEKSDNTTVKYRLPHLKGTGNNRKETVKKCIRRDLGLSCNPEFHAFFTEWDPDYREQSPIAVTAFAGSITKFKEPLMGEWVYINEAMSKDLSFNHDAILRSYIYRNENEKVGVSNEVLNEYSALRNEIDKRMGIRHQLTIGTLVLTGAFLTFGASEKVSVWALLLFPWVALSIAIAWVHSDVRAGELGEYIRKEIEPRFTCRQGWESHLRTLYATPGERGIRKRPVLSAFGIFSLSSATVLLLACVRCFVEDKWGPPWIVVGIAFTECLVVFYIILKLLTIRPRS